MSDVQASITILAGNGRRIEALVEITRFEPTRVATWRPLALAPTEGIDTAQASIAPGVACAA